MTKISTSTFLMLLCGAIVCRAGDGKKELDKLQGKWSVVSYEDADKTMDKDAVKSMEITFRGEQMTVRENDKVLLEFKLKLDSAKKPSTIDFIHLSGELKGNTEPGIYLIDGDNLRMCISEDAAKRPAEFKIDKKLPFSLMTLKRKPEPKGDEKQKEADKGAVQAFLKEKYPGKKWETGPNPVETAELTRMFPKLRFYYVMTSPPLPPGANLPDIQRAFRERLKEYQEKYMSLTVGFDESGKLFALSGPEDFNKIMPRVTSDDEARNGAAIIMSLIPSGAQPGPVSVKDVRVVAEKGGWSCEIANPKVFFSGHVRFDAKGRVETFSKSYSGPVPP